MSASHAISPVVLLLSSLLLSCGKAICRSLLDIIKNRVNSLILLMSIGRGEDQLTRYYSFYLS